MKPNNWTVQIIKFLNFKSPNFFKSWIEIETKSAFLIVAKIRALKVSNFQNILIQLSQLSKEVNKNILMTTILYCFWMHCQHNLENEKVQIMEIYQIENVIQLKKIVINYPNLSNQYFTIL